MTISTGELTHFSELLLKTREEVVARLERLKKERDFGDDVDSLEEEGDETEEFANQVELAESLETRRDRIDAALQKMKDGTYGVCEKCGGPITPNVLEVDPESELCQNCKSKKD